MTDNEQLLDDLCQAWRSTWVKMVRSDNERDRYYWLGVTHGLACAISATSGLPDRIQFMDTVRAGTDIARVRPGRTSAIDDAP
jgi:hypothetical protein